MKIKRKKLMICCKIIIKNLIIKKIIKLFIKEIIKKVKFKHNY